MKRYIWIVCGLLCLLGVAQAQEKTSPFWGKQEVYLVNQTVKTFELVNQLLAENPPSTEFNITAEWSSPKNTATFFMRS